MDVNNKIIEFLVSNDMLSENAIIVVEQEIDIKEVEGFTLKRYKYGYKQVGILRRVNL